MTTPDEALIAEWRELNVELRYLADSYRHDRRLTVALTRAGDALSSRPTVPDREEVASVPVKPTQAMVDAALRCHWSANLGERIRTIYAVMIDASKGVSNG